MSSAGSSPRRRSPTTRRRPGSRCTCHWRTSSPGRRPRRSVPCPCSADSPSRCGRLWTGLPTTGTSPPGPGSCVRAMRRTRCTSCERPARGGRRRRGGARARPGFGDRGARPAHRRTALGLDPGPPRQHPREVSRADFDADGPGPQAFPALAGVLAEQLSDARPPARAVGTRPVVVAVLGLHPGAPVDAVAAALWRELRPACGATCWPSLDPEALERAERAHDRVLLVADGRRRRAGDSRCARPTTWSWCPAASTRQPPPAWTGRAPTSCSSGPARREAGAAVVRAAEPVADHVSSARAPARGLRPARRAHRRHVGRPGHGRWRGRGFAHIGVLQVLAEAGIRVDRVAGCSIGAIVAGAYAAGIAPRRCTRSATRSSSAARRSVTTPLPTVSLAKGRRAGRAARQFGGADRGACRTSSAA